MIVCSINDAAIYERMHPAFPKAFAFLRDCLKQCPPDGRVEICDGCYAMVSRYETQPAETLCFEAHRAYLDIQMLCAGHEKLGVCQQALLAPCCDYDPQKDFQLYRGSGDFLTLTPGVLAILYPQDAHMPKALDGESAMEQKIVVKVKL